MRADMEKLQALYQDVTRQLAMARESLAQLTEACSRAAESEPGFFRSFLSLTPVEELENATARLEGADEQVRKSAMDKCRLFQDYADMYLWRENRSRPETGLIALLRSAGAEKADELMTKATGLEPDKDAGWYDRTVERLAEEAVDKQTFRQVHARQKGKAWEPGVRPGDTVTYGKYPASADGSKEKGIAWQVVDVQGDKALLLSRFILDAGEYHAFCTGVTWERSSLRAYLNGEFMDRAFTADEKLRIVCSEISNAAGEGHTGCMAKDESDTRDRVFCLSYREAERYLGEQSAKAIMTYYARAKRDKADSSEDKCGRWWLRSAGYNARNKLAVSENGMIGFAGLNDASIGIRPAMWLDSAAILSDQKTGDK